MIIVSSPYIVPREYSLVKRVWIKERRQLRIGMDSKESFRSKRLIGVLGRDHNELLRQIWILRMLISRGEWSDSETIYRRVIELEGHLEEHFRIEMSGIQEIFVETRTRERFEDLDAFTTKGSALIALIERINSLIPPSDETLRDLERSLCQHAKEEEMYLLSLPDGVNQETGNNTKDYAENEERLLVLS